jgi:hypothetical protein
VDSAVVIWHPFLVIDFLFWEAKISYTFLTKTKHAQRKLLYFVNRHDAESTQIGHNFRKKNVNSKNYPHFILVFR